MESNQNAMIRTPIKYFYTEEIAIYSNLKKNEIERIITIILSKFCNMNVIGYSKEFDEYYCKNVNNNKINLNLNVKLIEYNINITEIKITPIVSSKLNLKKFQEKLKNAIFDYEFDVEDTSLSM